VVITILAILGTIAFISLQGYSADARNSKRTQDLNSIAGSVNVKVTEWSSLLSFVNWTGSNLSNANIAGTWTTNNDYKASIINYTSLSIKASDFKDPTWSEYPIGVTTKKGWNFEIAAIIENSSSDKTAKINGTFNTRGIGSVTASSTGTNIVKINATDINKFFKWDVIWDGTNTGTITKISKDGVTITTDIQLTGTGLQLNGVESTGLIRWVTNTTAPVTNNWTNLPY